MKNLMMLGALAVFTVWGVGQLAPNTPGYASVMQAVGATPTTQVVQNQTNFHRSNTKDSDIHWTQMPCRDSRNGEYYESEILSREEVLYELQAVGFQGQMLEDFAAISLAESGRQVSCIADEHLVDAKWDVSYGVWAIRALKEQQGTGQCRDIERLRKNDFHDQTVCAWEISGQGKTFQPWSVTHSNRGKPYLQYLGK